MGEIIKFSGFAPDLDPTTPGIITDMSFVAPSMRGYRGGAGVADIGMASLGETPLAAATLFSMSGSLRTFVGSATKLYEKSGATWLNRSRATPAYGASVSNNWQFAQFGDTYLAVNKVDQLQFSTTGAFANLNAPTAATMCVWKGFVVLGNTTDGGSGMTYGDSLNRWWTSAYLDYTSWTPSISTQCTTGQLVETPGKITALKVLGEYIIAYKEKSIYVGRDAGSPAVLQFTLIPGEIGCASPNAIADIGSAHIFIGTQDIYIFDGNTVRPIGDPLRIWFFNDIDPQYINRTQALHNEKYSTVIFNYSKNGTSGALNGGIAYNYKTNTWGVAARAVNCPFEYTTGGYTYDTLPIEGKTYADWPSISYDDAYWDASKTLIAFFGPDNKIYTVIDINASSTAQAYIMTGSYGDETNYTFLDHVKLRYLVKPANPVTMTHYYSNDLGGTWTEGQTITESNGRFDVLWSALWHKVKFNITGMFEVTGVAAEAKPDGSI